MSTTTRIEREPVSIAGALRVSGDPPPGVEPPVGRCLTCGCELDPPRQWIWMGDHYFNPPRNCVPCGKIADAAHARTERKSIAEMIPVPLRDTDPELLPRDLYDVFMAWDGVGHQGIGIVGPPNTGKSRTLWLMLAWLAREGRNVQIVTAAELVSCVAEKDEWVRIQGAAILGLDNLGSVGLPQRVQDRAYAAIEARINRGLPTCWTADIVGDTAKRLLDIGRLLKENSRIYAWDAAQRRFVFQ